MKGNDEMTALFRNRLSGAEMPVRDGFWEQLQGDLLQAETAGKKRRPVFLFPRFHRVAAAASVIFVLSAASAAFWYFSPKREIGEAFTQAAVLTSSGRLDGDGVKETFPSIHESAPVNPNPASSQPASGGTPALLASQTGEEASISVSVSITIRQHRYGTNPRTDTGYRDASVVSHTGESSRVVTRDADAEQSTASSVEKQGASSLKKHTSRKWALKAALGTSLPKGEYHAPFTAGVTVERALTDRLSVEAGVQYNRLQGESTLHTLAVPVKANVLLASLSKFDLYATAGGAVEKCIAGASDNSFAAEPLQLSLAAGVGVRYRMNDRFALFAEPSVSHHFGTDSDTRSLRTERATNLNLLCGVRMTY